MVMREEVVWAYRLMLGREPENEAAINAACLLPDTESLRQTLLTSEEFAVTNKVTWLKGYWVAAPVMNGQYLMWIDLGDLLMVRAQAFHDRSERGLSGQQSREHGLVLDAALPAGQRDQGLRPQTALDRGDRHREILAAEHEGEVLDGAVALLGWTRRHALLNPREAQHDVAKLIGDPPAAASMDCPGRRWS